MTDGFTDDKDGLPAAQPEREAGVPDEQILDEATQHAGEPTSVEDTPEFEAYQQLLLENQQNMHTLNTGNPPMGLEPATLMSLRFETVLNALMPPESLERLQFETFYQREIAKALAEALTEQRKLLFKSRMQPPRLHMPGR